ncbi:L,D-transpeptidase family protein [Actinacidiphila yeochonensis]|uniref:L,D-transpeptidase family protein n=1 Tax=Actinacidiphila yeochonensis TaxID=89050 RepID=UPI000AF3659E|nr:L,D-transpeptidase family protein [Actinacidiphila yeochonensis]
MVIAVSVVAAAVGLLGAGYVATQHSGGGRTAAADNGRDTGKPAGTPAAAAPAATASRDPMPATIPGLGPKTLADVPAASRQVLVASGQAKDSSNTLVTLWVKLPDGHWRPGATWRGHNAKDGWTTDHHAGDLHSPIGVFTLHDAGGFDADPGSHLPYHHSDSFHAGGVGFDGEPLDEAFDYVIAIDYNRVPGTSPLDGTQPLGADKGGGIWVHVDHGGPTHGCVSIPAPDMVTLLRALQPADHPVIVMGDSTSLQS